MTNATQSSSDVDSAGTFSFSSDDWSQLKREGFVFARSEAFCAAFASMEAEIDAGNFDRRVSPLSLFEGYKSAEDFATHASSLQRDSWYLSPRYAGPFPPGKVRAVLDAARTIWGAVLDRIRQENPGVRYATQETIGFHRYYEQTEKLGLAEHKDSGLVTVLASTGSLEGYVEGRWQTLRIPTGHVMIFIGSVCELIDRNYHPLLHRVAGMNERKVSLGLFLDPAADDALVVDGAPTSRKVSEYHEAYFSLNRNVYPRFLQSIGREPANSY